MSSSGRNILITGMPGTGKTTLIRKLCENLSYLDPSGFYTAEIREGGIRKGFELVDLNGGGILLSHINIQSRFRVGKYGVDIDKFEKYLDNNDLLKSQAGLLIIDEIGKMECLSEKFVDLVLKALKSNRDIIATIALKGGSVIEKIRKRQDVTVYEITAGKRDAAYRHILKSFSRS